MPITFDLAVTQHTAAMRRLRSVSLQMATGKREMGGVRLDAANFSMAAKLDAPAPRLDPPPSNTATPTPLPGYHLTTTQADYDQCIAYSSSNQIPQSNFDAREEFNWSGTFVYNGIVYDNMRYRLRQRNFRYSGSGKRSFRFRFNRGHYAQFHDVWGDPYPTKWRTMNTHKNNTRDGNNFGLFEIANAILWKLTGTPAPSTPSPDPTSPDDIRTTRPCRSSLSRRPRRQDPAPVPTQPALVP